jgi:hypothetical protein
VQVGWFILGLALIALAPFVPRIRVFSGDWFPPRLRRFQLIGGAVVVGAAGLVMVVRSV